MPLHVAFLWHMHQPDYVDSVRNTALMPWVRLHATKGYLDMIWLADQYPEFHCTFNLTPVLLKQIEEFAMGRVRDQWHELAATPAADLTHEQKCGVLEHFFKANWDHMIKPYPRYWSLLHKRGTSSLPRLDLNRVVRDFSEQDYRDLQVWFNLTWFGYAAQHLYPPIAELKRKGQGFSEVDKLVVFEHQLTVLKQVLHYYRTVAQRGQIEISTTPFYHPIMPLVQNTEFARRCLPGRPLPPTFAHPEDVRAQLTLARDYHTQLFGSPPAGVWPSEGSVCPELIPILQETGFQWFATDEEILWRSLSVTQSGRQHDRADLFQGYRVQFGGAEICAAFRERTLSDFVGFSAARNEPRRAAEFMVNQINQIAADARGDDPLCAVVLDGENAWENFPDGGELFLRELYQKLCADSSVRTTTFHDYFTQHPPKATVHTLHTGSWINADFNIWIGQAEDNRGWELLGRTRDFLQAKADRQEIGTDQYRLAMDEIYAAEGSDWFWWYGEDFVTDNDVIFDELFRTHLQNVYRIVGAPVPDSLKTHICRSEVAVETRKPTGLIMPVIDGLPTTFYEWVGAGYYEAGRAMSAMYRTERLLEAIYFGFDLERFYLRVDFRPQEKAPPNCSLRINFIQPIAQAIIVPDLQPGPVTCELRDTSTEGGQQVLRGSVTAHFAKILELSVPLADLRWNPRDQVGFFVQILEADVESERHPDIRMLSLEVPDEEFELENWRI